MIKFFKEFFKNLREVILCKKIEKTNFIRDEKTILDRELEKRSWK